MPSAESVRVGLVGLVTTILPDGPALVEVTPADQAAVSRTSRKVQLESKTPTAVKAGKFKAFFVDDFMRSSIDTDDIKAFFTADAQLGAGAIVHALWEQYTAQVDKILDPATAHKEALRAEAKVVDGGDGDQVEDKWVDGQGKKSTFTRVYKNGLRLSMVVDFDKDENSVSDFVFVRPM